MADYQTQSGLAYVSRAARNFANRMGRWRLPAHLDWEDFAQQTHACLAHELGPDYGALIGAAMAEGPMFKKTPIYKTIGRCLWRADNSLKLTPVRKEVAKATVSLASVADPIAPECRASAPIDLAVQLIKAMERLSPEEQKIWELMCKYHKMSEIARKMGLSHQQARRLKEKIILKMQHVIKE